MSGLGVLELGVNEIGGWVPMVVADLLHTYYLTYTCLYNHHTHIIIEFVERMSQNTFLLITFLIFNGFSIQKKVLER